MQLLRIRRGSAISSLPALLSLLLVFALGCLAQTSSPTTSPAASVAAPPRNVILIGWDGAQRNHVKESLGRGELPNLKKLSSEGALVAIDIYRVTDTKAGWTQILTGYEPEVTGVFSNSRYQPIPAGYTVFERLEQFFGAQGIVTAAVIGKKANLGADPDEPYYYTKNSMDVFINGLVDDEKVGSKALELLEQYKDRPFFFFIHFAEVDARGHAFGENSKEYNDALISADTWLGSIVQKLKELNLYDKTLVYVTPDHGFDEGLQSHTDAPYVFLATNDPMVIRRGQRADITPTILDRFGLDFSKIEPPLDGHPLTRPYEAPRW